MIQPQELRKGNKIIANGLHCGRILTVDRLASKGTLSEDLRPVMFDEHEVGEFLKDCEGVPLTPEILEACGFQKDEEQELAPIVHKYRIKFPLQGANEHYIVAYIQEEGEKMSWATYTVNDYWASNNIFYLHQLQNLFFALTGSELSVNLEKVKQPSHD